MYAAAIELAGKETYAIDRTAMNFVHRKVRGFSVDVSAWVALLKPGLEQSTFPVSASSPFRIYYLRLSKLDFSAWSTVGA